MPAVWPGVCSASTSRPPTRGVAGVDGRRRARRRGALAGGEDLRVGVALEHAPSSQHVVVVVVGEQQVRDVDPRARPPSSSGATGPPASMRNASPPGRRPTR